MASTQMDFDKDENISFETSKGVNVVNTFDAMGIREDLLRGLYSYGFEKPSAIQQRAVMPICSGRDVIAQAQSGTGKSSMISLALCQMLDTSTREVQALVLSPTRELATQTERWRWRWETSCPCKSTRASAGCPRLWTSRRCTRGLART